MLRFGDGGCPEVKYNLGLPIEKNIVSPSRIPKLIRINIIVMTVNLIDSSVSDSAKQLACFIPFKLFRNHMKSVQWLSIFR